MPTPQDTMVAALQQQPQQQQYVYGFPSPSDVAFAQKYDATYGTPFDALINKDYPVNNIPSLPQVADAYDDVQHPLGNHSQPITSEDIRNRMYANYLASLHSPVAALGMQNGPGNVYTTAHPDPNKALSVVGFFSPHTNDMWFDQRTPSEMTHEATHSGINQLRQSGTPVARDPMEEIYVRALMNRHFGDAELLDNANLFNTTPDKLGHGGGGAQIAAGKLFNKTEPNTLDKLEEEATKLYHKRDQVMGPR